MYKPLDRITSVQIVEIIKIYDLISYDFLFLMEEFSVQPPEAKGKIYVQLCAISENLKLDVTHFDEFLF